MLLRKWVRLNLADVLKMERYPPLRFSLFLGWKLTIVEQSCTIQGHFTLTSSHALIAKYSNYLLSILWTLTFVYILQNMCLEILILLFYYDTRFVQLWWMRNDYLQENTWCCILFPQLNTTGKGELIDQIESNSQMRSTFLSEYTYKVIIVHYIK